MTDPVENTYFDDQYLGTTLVWGLLTTNLLANMGMMLYPIRWYTTGTLKNKGKSWWTRWAWGWMIGGTEMWYYFPGLVWLFAYI